MELSRLKNKNYPPLELAHWFLDWFGWEKNYAKKFRAQKKLYTLEIDIDM